MTHGFDVAAKTRKMGGRGDGCDSITNFPPWEIQALVSPAQGNESLEIYYAHNGH